jgi:phage-related protein
MAYVAVFPEVVYVLDVFEKKARKGKTTPTPDNQRVRAAFRTARSHYMSIFGGRA